MNIAIATLARRLVTDNILTLIAKCFYGRNAANFCSNCKDKNAFLWNAFRVLDFNGIEGDYLEFGCHTGITFRYAYNHIRRSLMQRHMWAFDSFKGLPEIANIKDKHPAWGSKSFCTDIEKFKKICFWHGIPTNKYSVVEGFYEFSLPEISSESGPRSVALAYIDCDLYSSTKKVLEFLEHRIKHGTIIAFDDYFSWSPKYASGEKLAFAEMITNKPRWHFEPYKSFGFAGMSFIVEILE